MTIEKKAIKLAIHALEDYRRKHYAAANSAAVFGFEFGILGKKHYDEYTEAIGYLRPLLEHNDSTQPALLERMNDVR